MNIGFRELERIVETLKPLSECPSSALGSQKKHFTHVRVEPHYNKGGNLDYRLEFFNPGEGMSIGGCYIEEDVRNLTLSSSE